MSNKRIFALALVVPVTIAITLAIVLTSWFVTPGTAQGIAGFSPLAIFRPVWKDHFKQRMLSTMVGDATAVIPSCHACQFEQCRTGFAEALDSCFRRFEDQIPVVVYNGRALGSQIGSCTDSAISKTVGPLLPSPTCDQALVTLAHTLGSSKDLRVFEPFLARFPALKAAFEQDASVLPKIQEAYRSFQQKDLARVTLMLRTIKSPLIRRAALESANVKAIKASFQNTLDLFSSPHCVQLIDVGMQPPAASTFSEMDFGSATNPLKANAGLQAEVIRSLSQKLETPWSVERLIAEVDPLMEDLPPDALEALEKLDQGGKYICLMGKGVAETYPSWSESQQELVARFMVYSFDNG